MTPPTTTLTAQTDEFMRLLVLDPLFQNAIEAVFQTARMAGAGEDEIVAMLHAQLLRAHSQLEGPTQGMVQARAEAFIGMVHGQGNEVV